MRAWRGNSDLDRGLRPAARPPRWGRAVDGGSSRLRLACVAACLALAGCGGVRGSGKAASETRSVGTFSELEASSVMHVELRQQAQSSLELSGDDNLLPLVTSEVSGKRLLLGTKQSVSPKLDLLAKASAARIELLRCSGACRITASDVDSDRLVLELSGAGEIRAAGKAGELRIDVSGAGETNAEALAAPSVWVKVSGAGRVTLGSPQQLDVEISGTGSVSYAGEPKISQRISGVGQLRKR